MIEFSGYITGAAKKHYDKKNRQMGRNMVLVAELLVMPLIIILAIMTRMWLILPGYAFCMVAGVVLIQLPKSKKDDKAFTTKRVYVKDGYITYESDAAEQTKNIDVVSKVFDYGEFYELTFPVGNMSTQYICQKDFLTKGTLEEFEALFEGKLEKK